MTQTRLRSPSPPASNKRAKRFALTDDIESRFTSGLLAHPNALKLNQEYLSSEPYKYCIIDKLIDDALLTQVKDECIDQLSFTEKSTDIYKVWRCYLACSSTFLISFQYRFIKPAILLRYHIYQRSNWTCYQAY